MENDIALKGIDNVLFWGDITQSNKDVIKQSGIRHTEYYVGDDVRQSLDNNAPDIVVVVVSQLYKAIEQIGILKDTFASTPVICLMSQDMMPHSSRMLNSGVSETLAISDLTTLTLQNSMDQALARQSYINRCIEGYQFDSLTGIANRQMFDSHLLAVLQRAKRFNTNVAVIFLDLDRFKSVNDTMGHKVGYQLLIEVARRLAGAIRTSDMVARLSGDEFALVIDNMTNIEDAENVAKKILALFSEPFDIVSTKMSIGASLGIASYPNTASDVENIVEYADMAMYQAKNRGRNQYVVYSYNEQESQGNEVEFALQRALTAGELSIFYQPKIELNTGKVLGAEALLRWHSRTLGDIPPSKFIPVAERLGIMVPISEWVVREVCKDSAIWQNKGLPRVPVSINIGGREVRTEGFVSKLSNILQESDRMTGLIELEITEKVLLELNSHDQSILNDIKALGIKIAVDDFGGETVSLTTLKNNIVDTLKIDPAMTKAIVNNKNDALVSESIIELASKLNVEVVAEGIESQEQLLALQKQGCNIVQGFVYCEPMSQQHFTDLLLQSHKDPNFTLKPLR